MSWGSSTPQSGTLHALGLNVSDVGLELAERLGDEGDCGDRFVESPASEEDASEEDESF